MVEVVSFQRRVMCTALEVLMLVIVSGRRPLQVVASAFSEFERANLISWARHAAHAGRILDIVDASMHGEYLKTQVTLCISLALLCLQRLPAVRPTMAEVAKILAGQTQLPQLPTEFSPSPPSGVSPYKTHRKVSADQVSIDLPLLL
ncbi:hypothetical protein O6H91_Y532600 [Diphasiastrum complanatum]|nr:hypothetical protein O6H91_Y532600 [Diphasiastrum complanatum]